MRPPTVMSSIEPATAGQSDGKFVRSQINKENHIKEEHRIKNIEHIRTCKNLLELDCLKENNLQSDLLPSTALASRGSGP